MAGKLFVNYRREDARADARNMRDRLTNVFGASNVFMDVDNLQPGQRFDHELAKALRLCDVFLAVIGPRWQALLEERAGAGARDYVREEIAAALSLGVVVIPVLIERTQLPPYDQLPADIRALAMHQKQDVVHERFGRDMSDLIKAIKNVRRRSRRVVPWRTFAVASIALVTLAFVVLGAALFLYLPKGNVKTQVDDEGVVRIKEAGLKKVVAPPLKFLSPSRAASPLTIAEEQALKPKDSFQECDACPEMVVVPAGGFIMGSNEHDSEKPEHKVLIQWPFAVGKYEVTSDEWEACVKGGGCKSNPAPMDLGLKKGRRPVINVSWNDAKEYVVWLSRKTAKNYRLLTEAEWEYAARAGTTTKYAFGDVITNGQAQFSEGIWGSSGNTIEVGSFPPNAFGLHDMHGNVWEWCEDGWHENYQGAPQDGSAWQSQGGTKSGRVLRGGSWFSKLDGLRSADRSSVEGDVREDRIGFRIARTL